MDNKTQYSNVISDIASLFIGRRPGQQRSEEGEGHRTICVDMLWKNVPSRKNPKSKVSGMFETEPGALCGWNEALKGDGIRRKIGPDPVGSQDF